MTIAGKMYFEPRLCTQKRGAAIGWPLAERSYDLIYQFADSAPVLRPGIAPRAKITGDENVGRRTGISRRDDDLVKDFDRGLNAG